MIDELPCLEYPDDNQIIGSVAILTTCSLIMMVSVYVVIVHLLFKELQTLLGKLFIFHSLCIVSTTIDIMALVIMHYWIMVNSQAICHAATIIFTLSSAGTALFATNISTHVAYLMYRCYHLKSEISKKRSNFLFRYYTAFAAFTLILLFFVTIAYDWRTRNG